MVRGNGDHEENSDYWNGNKGHYLDYIDRHFTYYKLKEKSVDFNQPAACSRVAMVIDHFGKPGENGAMNDGTDFKRWTWKIKTEVALCDVDIMKNSRPMCVVSGENVPQAVKDQAIDIKAEGLLADKIIKRQNEIQQMLDQPRQARTLVKVLKIVIIGVILVAVTVFFIKNRHELVYLLKFFKKMKNSKNKVGDDENNQIITKINMNSSLKQVTDELEKREREIMYLRTIQIKLKRKR